MMNSFLQALTSFVLLFSFVFSLSPAAWAAEWKTPLIPITQDFTLPNGLRVVMSEDHAVPVAAMVIVYDVGARNEVKGKSGFAHLFEHMMFEGSENVGKTEHFKYVEGVGGSVNAATHSDFTDYYNKLPSNQIELAMWLESDRMRSLKVTEENFKNQLETVKEEKRSRIDNQPYTPAALKFGELMFENWNNAHPIIGSFEDLESSSIADVRQFFKTYYAPNNATMAIVGDFDSNEMKKLVEKYFGSIPRQPAPAKPDVTEPAQSKQKYLKVEDKLAKMPAFYVGWKVPPRRSPDNYVLSVIENILSAGDSSRLYQRLIKGDKVALSAHAYMDDRRGPGSFQSFVMFKPGNTAEKVREILLSEIDRLKTEPVSQEELNKAKNQIMRSLFSSGSHSSLQRALGRANMIAQYAAFYGDPKLVEQDLEALMKVTPEDVQRVAKKTFTREGMTVLDIEPVSDKKVSSNQESNRAN
jgi:zinc protease